MLNSQHKDIRFTVEKATKFSTLNFLDVQIKLLDNGYETCVWRKPTNTGVLLNFNAICPTSWKTGLITCLLHRAKFVCSNSELYTREVKKLCKIFQNNGYPNWFINNVIKKFEENNNTSSNYEKDFMFTIGLPYFGKPSQPFAKKLSNFVKMKFDVDINVYYVALKVGSYFQLKCVTPVELVSNVVYKFSCSCDTNMSYIGMTTRHLGTRIQEHLQPKAKSAIRDHINDCQSCKQANINVDSFKVIKTCNTEYNSKIQEALLIKKHNPKLNTQLYAGGSSFLLNKF